MKSMTGFGVGEQSLGDGKIVVEVRALNHRYVEVRTSVAPELSCYGFALEQVVRARLDRGRYDISVRLSGHTPLAPRLDLDRARASYAALTRLRDELAPGSELPIAVLASVPELFSLPSPEDHHGLRDSLFQAVHAALDDLERMQRYEGDKMRSELSDCLDRLRQLRVALDERCAGQVTRARERLHDRLARLLGDQQLAVDAGRLETEVAILADKSDVSEELVRLESHFAQLEILLAGDESVGRRVDFLLQEVAREANTIASKGQDAAVSQLIVEVKAEVERMRQQAANVA
jgi:uncharacterized protein (TIGR00255 family)